MNSKKHWMKKPKLWLGLFTWALSACSTIQLPDTEACTVAGTLNSGGICATTISGKVRRLNLDQMIDLIEAQPARPDPANPGKILPAHGAALIMSSEDYMKNKTALEQACKKLGVKCHYDLPAQLMLAIPEMK